MINQFGTCPERARRDEDRDLGAKIRASLGAEADDFLGQRIIELRTLSSGESDLWFNLGAPALSFPSLP